jgi:hypothetical protein
MLRLCLLLCFAATLALGHPIPDIPVKAEFGKDGSARILVELDPRLFATDPDKAPYLLNQELPTGEAASALLKQAADYAASRLSFRFEPLGEVKPDFQWSLTGEQAAALALPEDKVMVTGQWKTTVPQGIGGYRVKALPVGDRSVVVVNSLNGQVVERLNVLFPGEESYLLSLAGSGATAALGESAVTGTESNSWWFVFVDMLRQGFLHVLPLGLDHILFVLGLFLLSRKWKPILLQVTAFTLAHTVTLGLATLGYVEAPGEAVEPIIAASIAVVALENIFGKGYTHWRLLITFVFGLVHGLGFAGALSELDLPPASLITGLLGFNIGVEGGQLAVIALAFVATLAVPTQHYRKFVVIPGSLMIAAMGIYWTLGRVGLI